MVPALAGTGFQGGEGPTIAKYNQKRLNVGPGGGMYIRYVFSFYIFYCLCMRCRSVQLTTVIDVVFLFLAILLQEKGEKIQWRGVG